MPNITVPNVSAPGGLQQLKPVDGPTPAQEALSAAGVTPIQASPLEQNLFRLFELVERYISPEMSGRYGALLQDIAEDQIYADQTYLGLLRSPRCADPGLRFNTEGGLVQSVLAAWSLWEAFRDGAPDGWRLSATWREDTDVTDENVLQALIHQALPLGWAHFIQVEADEFQVLPGDHESDVLLSPAGKTVLLLSQREIVLDGQMLHLLFPNHGRAVIHHSALFGVMRKLGMMTGTQL